MRNIIRQVDAVYEATGPYALEKEEAEDIFTSAYGILNGYIGGISIKNIRGIRIVHPTDEFNFTKAKLGTSRHKSFLTRRQIINPHNPNSKILGICDSTVTETRNREPILNKTATYVQALPTDEDQYRTLAVATAVHEGAHSFGLAHCEDDCCLMAMGINTQIGNESRGYIEESNPFCNDCTDSLALTGLQELARQL